MIAVDDGAVMDIPDQRDLEAVEQEKLRVLARAWLRFDLEWERPGST